MKISEVVIFKRSCKHYYIKIVKISVSIHYVKLLKVAKITKIPKVVKFFKSSNNFQEYLK